MDVPRFFPLSVSRWTLELFHLGTLLTSFHMSIPLVLWGIDGGRCPGYMPTVIDFIRPAALFPGRPAISHSNAWSFQLPTSQQLAITGSWLPSGCEGVAMVSTAGVERLILSSLGICASSLEKRKLAQTFRPFSNQAARADFDVSVRSPFGRFANRSFRSLCYLFVYWGSSLRWPLICLLFILFLCSPGVANHCRIPNPWLCSFLYKT